MQDEPNTDTTEHEDERATVAPADDDAGGADTGSQGNPEVDEEALAHRQQERAAEGRS